MTKYKYTSPKEMREIIREGKYKGNTAGISHGYAQGNLVVLPKKYAYDFLLFSQRNPKQCPILEVSEVGHTEFKESAPGSDIRRDLSKYRVYRDGKLENEVFNIDEYWEEDFVSFLIGCSFTFEASMIDAGIDIRHISSGKNVPMYITNIKCKDAGIFSGPTVVSMRPLVSKDVIRATQITSKYPAVHGGPIHIGNPEEIGIKDINNPNFGDSVEIKEGEVPVFWACGVTPQAIAMEIKPELMITHSPGHMFITDIKNKDLEIN